MESAAAGEEYRKGGGIGFERRAGNRYNGSNAGEVTFDAGKWENRSEIVCPALLVVTSKLTRFSSTQYLILDEADRLIGPDFLPQVSPILEAHDGQKIMLSATMEAGAEALAKTWMKETAVRVVVGLK